jgi:CheY-like chemotaxis protein
MRILVIDDNEEVREVLSFYCEQEDIDCTLLDNGENALKEIRNNGFDLILLDIAMPNYTGIDVISSLKEHGLFESKNIVIMTASSDKKMLEELKRNGIKDILLKPASLEELADLINRYRRVNGKRFTL